MRRLHSHTQESIIHSVEAGWINWAGPPDLLVADGERGFASEAFAEAMGRAGTLYVPSAAYAPWQKGKVERANQTVRMIISRCVLHKGLKGVSDMTAAGAEAASAINARPGPIWRQPGHDALRAAAEAIR